MTKEEKELLLKDFYARLPYGVKCRFETTVDTYETIEFNREETNGLLVDFDEIYCYWLNEGFIFPYLRPLSSMSEKESEEYNDLTNLMSDYDSTIENIATKIIDWFNSHHFDYRGLIGKGLALEALEGMY